MKHIKIFEKDNPSKVMKISFYLTYGVILILYSISLLIIMFPLTFFPDADTSSYWAYELFLSATYSLNVLLISVFIIGIINNHESC